MKSQLRKSCIWIFAVAVCVMAVSSCKKILEVEPQSTLGREQTYRNVFDADAAVIGVYGKFMNLAKQYIVLNELRADLMSVTTNADDYLKQINTHNVTIDNPYANPQPFYEVILNCNDVMKNFDIMLRDKKLKVDEYNQRYSDVASIRTWVYLQLGIHFGTVPYVTDALDNINELKTEGNFPKLEFRLLLVELIKTMEALPFKEIYSAGSLVTTVDQYNTQKFFINKNVLLGELHLWNGAYENASYRKAAAAYKEVMLTPNKLGQDINGLFNTYRIGFPDVTIANNIAVQYTRFRETDISALIENTTEGWRSIFSRGMVNYDALFNYEWIWVLPFNKNFQPANPFIDLFSNRGGSYLVKPSKQAIDNWNSQTQINNFPFDARGRFTYKTIGNQPVIMKHLYYSLSPSGNQILSANGRTGDWFLYRAASLHLHFAEAANRDGRSKIAYALVNQGLSNTFDDPSNVDKTNLMQTFDVFPYDFMARNGNPPGPVYRDEWFHNTGIRGRAYLKPIPVTNAADSVNQIEDMIVNEGALELAYEGQRWSDLLRVAIRKKDPTYLADKVYDKLRKDEVPGAEGIRAKLVKGDWYLPFKWQ